jgi:hypothetical protein
VVVKKVELVKDKELGGLLLEEEKGEEARQIKVRNLIGERDG